MNKNIYIIKISFIIIICRRRYASESEVKLPQSILLNNEGIIDKYDMITSMKTKQSRKG